MRATPLITMQACIWNLIEYPLPLSAEESKSSVLCCSYYELKIFDTCGNQLIHMYRQSKMFQKRQVRNLPNCIILSEVELKLKSGRLKAIKYFRRPDRQKIIDTPGGQINDPHLGKQFSLPFLPGNFLVLVLDP